MRINFSEPTFEDLMTMKIPITVAEECAARSYLRVDNYYKRRKDGLCIVCREPLPKRRLRYCSDACGKWFSENHDWGPASHAALRANIEVNFVLQHVVSVIPGGAHWRTGEIIPERRSERDVKRGCCSRCKQPELDYAYLGDGTYRAHLDSRLEVDHIIPLNGRYRVKSCENHQSNLRVVCHRDHIEITKEQRRLGLIGKK